MKTFLILCFTVQLFWEMLYPQSRDWHFKFQKIFFQGLQLLKNCPFPTSFWLIFVISTESNRSIHIDTSGFEPRPSGVGSDCSAYGPQRPKFVKTWPAYLWCHQDLIRRTRIDRISDWPNGFRSTWMYLFKHTKCTPFVKPRGFGQSKMQSIRCLL